MECDFVYTLILVDDDKIICDGLSTYFPWQEIGFEFLRGFTNSEEAWEYIKKNKHIDVVLTDICMPGMDGIELAARLHKHYPKIWICFLTAYQEFSYAYKAINLNVRKYIIKSSQYNELIRAFSDLHQELDQTKVSLPIKSKKSRTSDSYENTEQLILQIIQKDIQNASLQSVADQIGMHPSYLSKYFKEHFDINFIDYITQIKMQYALQFLKNGSSIADVSLSLGYSSENNFSRAFKKYTGITPRAYKESESI